MEKILKIEEVHNIGLVSRKLNGENGSQLGMSAMINTIFGGGGKDGYKITTDKEECYILIDNGQSCCESWGYFASEDDFGNFIGSTLNEIKFTDTALNKKKFDESGYYDDNGGIVFVDFETSKGVLQFAVYNAHNGYYGHGILIVKGENILKEDTL